MALGAEIAHFPARNRRMVIASKLDRTEPARPFARPHAAATVAAAAAAVTTPDWFSTGEDDNNNVEQETRDTF